VRKPTNISCLFGFTTNVYLERLCCEHGHKCTKILKASVACQTDPDENDLDYKSEFKDKWMFKHNSLLDPFNPIEDTMPTNASYDQQTVAQDLCHAKGSTYAQH